MGANPNFAMRKLWVSNEMRESVLYRIALDIAGDKAECPGRYGIADDIVNDYAEAIPMIRGLYCLWGEASRVSKNDVQKERKDKRQESNNDHVRPRAFEG